MRAADVVTAVRRRYGCEGDDGIGPEWASLDELELTGRSTRRIDLLMVRAWGGAPKGHERHAIEVKVSRADLRAELDQPEKWGAWAQHVHRFYLAVPADLPLDGLDLPDRWGVYTVDGRRTRKLREAVCLHEPEPLPDRCHVEVFRRAGRAEARIRDASSGDLPAEVARLTREVAAAERATITARQAEQRWRDRAAQALDLFARVAPTVHCQCGTTVKLHRGRNSFGRVGIRWHHVGEPGQNRYGVCEYPHPDLERLADEFAEVPS